MSDTRFEAQRYMSLMAQLPAFFAGGAEDALLICFGVGNTARSLLASPELERLDVVDIAKEVFTLSPHFADVHGGDPLDDPRTHVVVADGRQHILTTDQRYDVITAEPPPPTDAGVVNLYSQEFYAASKRALKPGGVLAQWLPLYSLSERETTMMIAAFLAEFLHAVLLTGWEYQWILLGSEEPLRVDLPAWEARFTRLRPELDRIGIRDVSDLLLTFLMGDAELRRVTDGVRPVTDDYPSLQYPRHEIAGRVEAPPRYLGPPGDVVALVDGALPPDFAARAEAEAASRAAWPWFVFQLSAEREMGSVHTVGKALAVSPGHPLYLAMLQLADDHITPARASLDGGQGSIPAVLAVARAALWTGDPATALAWLDRVPPPHRADPLYLVVRGGAERALGHPEVASSTWRAALAIGSPQLNRRLAELIDCAGAPSWHPLSCEPPSASAGEPVFDEPVGGDALDEAEQVRRRHDPHELGSTNDR